jgi:hypothetical protein
LAGLVRQWVRGIGVLIVVAGSRPVLAQTPSPLQEWRYSGGVILARLFEPDPPEYRRIVGIAADVDPVYSGARALRVQGGPDINIYYRDIAFITSGDGVG